VTTLELDFNDCVQTGAILQNDHQENTLWFIHAKRLRDQNSENNIFFCVCKPIRRIALQLVSMVSSTLKDISQLVKFDGNNFHKLKFGCRLLLETRGLLDVIDGIEKIRG
jgi:hypothetical protein